MELVKKTTILFPPDLYAELTLLARRNKSSVGELVRDACRRQYGRPTRNERLAAVAELAQLGLPTGSPEQMEAESVPQAEPLP
jgi:hypothetical protein